MRLAITTPTGHIGSRVVERLLETDHDLVLLARDPAKLPDATRQRAEVLQGDLENADDVRRLVQGADALFYLVPPNFTVAENWRGWIGKVGRIAADAVREAGVSRVVLISSYGAQADGLGPISAVGDVEKMLEAAAPNVVHLRAGSFMENYLANLPQIAAEGVLYNANPSDLPFAMVATRDIGDVAARWLADDGWTGHRVVGVHGPADLTQVEAAAQIGEGLGRDVRHVQVPVEAFLGVMAGLGAGEGFLSGYREMLGTWAEGATHQAEPRTPETTTPTTLRQFAADVLAPALPAPSEAARS